MTRTAVPLQAFAEKFDRVRRLLVLIILAQRDISLGKSMLVSEGGWYTQWQEVRDPREITEDL